MRKERDYHSQIKDPQGPEKGKCKVVRGGSWSSSGRVVRSADRSGGNPDDRSSITGFRLARGKDTE